MPAGITVTAARRSGNQYSCHAFYDTCVVAGVLFGALTWVNALSFYYGYVEVPSRLSVDNVKSESNAKV